MQTITGWDIGGAHLKIARLEGARLVQAATLPSPLWQGLERLDEAMRQALAGHGAATRHVITMSGEMSDLFASRAEGVEALLARAAQNLGTENFACYAGARGFVDLAAARAAPELVGSANWHAAAALAAQRLGHGLHMDMGSTTTDISPLIDGKVATRGHDDASRAEHGELVYTGLTRTFVMALAHRAPFAGRWRNLMQEYFANMADVRRILGDLPDHADAMNTADGRDKSVAASCNRLARMIGCEADAATLAQWQDLARFFSHRQQRLLEDNFAQVRSRHDIAPPCPVICSGTGRALLMHMAQLWGHEAHDFATLFEATPHLTGEAAEAAPAAAIALLAAGLT
ncbi:MAG: H4MPT-linked C1 transfer pathway protein [Hyphomicrobiales bacterium]|nr:H4MPT-linked C1 transfer pathway protein [Hyphomicrobiales bacterium]